MAPTEIALCFEGIGSIPPTQNVTYNPNWGKKGQQMYKRTVRDMPLSPLSSASCNSSVKNRNIPETSG